MGNAGYGIFEALLILGAKSQDISASKTLALEVRELSCQPEEKKVQTSGSCC